MKILMLSWEFPPHVVGGLGRHVFHLSKTLASKGFDISVLTFTDGSNLKLAGNFVTTADDTITLAYDGTNWYEICRSVN